MSAVFVCVHFCVSRLHFCSGTRFSKHADKTDVSTTLTVGTMHEGCVPAICSKPYLCKARQIPIQAAQRAMLDPRFWQHQNHQESQNWSCTFVYHLRLPKKTVCFLKITSNTASIRKPCTCTGLLHETCHCRGCNKMQPNNNTFLPPPPRHPPSPKKHQTSKSVEGFFSTAASAKPTNNYNKHLHTHKKHKYWRLELFLFKMLFRQA